MTMNGAVMTLARYEARQIIKRELYAQGIKLARLKAGRSPSLPIDTLTIILRSSRSRLNVIGILLREAY